MAHSLVVIVYHVLTEQAPYKEWGATYLAERNRVRSEQRAIRMLEQLGYQVELHPRAPVAPETDIPPDSEVA